MTKNQQVSSHENIKKNLNPSGLYTLTKSGSFQKPSSSTNQYYSSSPESRKQRVKLSYKYSESAPKDSVEV